MEITMFFKHLKDVWPQVWEIHEQIIRTQRKKSDKMWIFSFAYTNWEINICVAYFHKS